VESYHTSEISTSAKGYGNYVHSQAQLQVLSQILSTFHLRMQLRQDAEKAKITAGI
jgi:hypothetical protein